MSFDTNWLADKKRYILKTKTAESRRTLNTLKLCIVVVVWMGEEILMDVNGSALWSCLHVLKQRNYNDEMLIGRY